MVLPSAEELGSLSAACQRLWDLDTNRLQPGRDYGLNVQRGKKPFDTSSDVAAEPLFRFVNPEIYRKRNYGLFHKLLDNYERGTGVAEKVSREEEAEISEFLDEVLKSQTMQFVHEILKAKNLAPANTKSFKDMLYQMWFSLYRRGVQNDSCGFEHVFVGESKDGKISGFHNWLQFYNEEKNGQVDYKGYIIPRQRGPNAAVTDDERLLTLQFGWDGEVKDVSSIFIGTSPDFEMALYTLCFIAGEEENLVEVGNYDVKIRCYRIRSNQGDKVGSAFPELMVKVPGRKSDAPPGGAPAFVAQPAAPSALNVEAPVPRPQGAAPGSYAAAAQQPAAVHNNAAYGAPSHPPRVQQQAAGGQGDGGKADQGCGPLIKILIDIVAGCFKKK